MQAQLSIAQIKAQITAAFAPHSVIFFEHDHGDQLGFAVRSSAGVILREFPPAALDELKNPDALRTRIAQFQVG